MERFLQHQKGFFALLLALSLGMGTAQAYSFSATCSTGQTLYYNIINSANRWVEITYPGTSYSSPWNGYAKPTGNITLPSSVSDNGINYTVKRIGDYAFYYCNGMTGSLTIPNTVTSIGDYAFYYCNAMTGSLTIPNSVTTIGEYAFGHCSGLTGSLTIPNTVTSIDYAAFAYCSGFSGSLNIPNSVTTIDGHVFYGCSGFSGSLNIPNSVTAIGDLAFTECSGFTGSLTIPNSVVTIGLAAFEDCTGFTGMLTIGSSVTSISNEGFRNCSGFTSMTVLPETPPTLWYYAFSYDIPVYVPCIALEDYQAASGWSSFTNIQCIPDPLTVYDGTVTSSTVPAYIFYFDFSTRSQFVIPAEDLVEMIGTPINSITFYTTSTNVPYTTVSSADVYLKEVSYTSISAYEPKSSATIVYSGYFDIVSSGNGGEMTINFSTPYLYNGGNLLVGIENTENIGYKDIFFYGQTVSGASISDSNGGSSGSIPATQRNFIPKTSFRFLPTCEAKSLPYTYGFEEEDEFECWTMLRCATYTGRDTYSEHEGEYGFRFCYNTDPPQYLISPKLEGDVAMNVSFYYKNASDSWPETFQVGYSTTTKSPSAFTWGTVVTANDQSTWKLYKDYIPEGAKYVAVKYNSYDKDQLYLDDFSFVPVPEFCSPEDQCELTFTLTDSYGDGWNGAAIKVVDVESDIVLATMTNVTNDHSNAPITETYTLTVCDGRELRFEWVSGSWNNECSYVVTDINGVEVFSGSGAMSESFTFTVSCDVFQVQTVALTAGLNWFSTYVQITLEDLQAALVATGNTSITIASQSGGSTTYNGTRWRGSLSTLDVKQMYKITVGTACEIALEDLPINPAENPVTIHNGSNWIGFPLGTSMTLTDAFVGFAVNGDMVVSQSNGSATYTGGRWRGSLTTLEPGKGYNYKSASSATRVLWFEHEYVDLGLPSGLLWATCNVGANSPEDYGDYFAWGETQPKDYYDWSTYQHCMGSYTTLTKYCSNSNYGYNGFTDNLTTLLPEDDAAMANWGSDWRMPTKAEFQELIDNTTVTWTTQNGVNGLLFTAANGNSLFLPAAGSRVGSSLNYAGSIGGDWSSSLNTNNSRCVWYIHIQWDNNSMGNNGLRYYGLTVRPVRCRALPEGAIDGKFTINAEGGRVCFSQGNLQYNASTDTWRFAEHQYDCIGSGNSNISSSYNGYIDLFGWGTSGYNHGANCYQPWSTSRTYSDYYAYGSATYNLNDQTGQADWGYNAISNGGNTTHQWRTLTKEEWTYVFNTRTTSSGMRYAKAKVNGVNGVILLPDDWSSSTYSLSHTNTAVASYSNNTITAAQWTTLENAGAVFLPAAGLRDETSVSDVDSYGYYWSASYYGFNASYCVTFGDYNIFLDSYTFRDSGLSVRVVCPAD